MGELFWVMSTALRLPDSAARGTALRALHDREIAEYARIRRCARVVEWEGPARAAGAAHVLQKATGPFHEAVRADLDGEHDGGPAFDAAHRPFRKALEDSADAARTAHRRERDHGQKARGQDVLAPERILNTIRR
ncbi:hypothetical protein [Streptomyces sp. NPDC048650]|uniref:hypothetical protein n=1 Tax=Streptomyces sp. NPDC048650 TaxID=3365583 RepID=UPI003721854C